MAAEGLETGGRGVEMIGWFESLLVRDFLLRTSFMAEVMAEEKKVVEVDREEQTSRKLKSVDRRIGRGSDLGRDKNECKLAQLNGPFSRYPSSCLLFRSPGLKKNKLSSEHMSGITVHPHMFFSLFTLNPTLWRS